MDLEKLARVIMELLKVGELNYEGPCSDVVQEQANKAAEDAEKLVSMVPSVESLDNLEEMVVAALMNNSDVKQEIMNQSNKMPASGRSPCQSSLRVNLAGLSAENHPRHSQRNMWMRHTTWKVVQGQIISGVQKGKVVNQVAGAKETMDIMINMLSLYRKFRQVQMDIEKAAEVMAISGLDSVDKQEIKKIEEYLSLFCSSYTRRDPGVYHTVYTAGCGTHEEPCNGCSTVPVG